MYQVNQAQVGSQERPEACHIGGKGRLGWGQFKILEWGGPAGCVWWGAEEESGMEGHCFHSASAQSRTHCSSPIRHPVRHQMETGQGRVAMAGLSPDPHLLPQAMMVTTAKGQESWCPRRSKKAAARFLALLYSSRTFHSSWGNGTRVPSLKPGLIFICLNEQHWAEIT